MATTRSRVARTVAGTLAAVSLGGGTGFAQAAPPSAGEGPVGRATPAPQSLSATVGISGGYDDDLSNGPTAAAGAGAAGQYASVDSSLALARTTRHTTLTAGLTSSARRYQDLDGFVGSSGSAAANFTVAFDPRTRLRAAADAWHVSDFAFEALSQGPVVGVPNRPPTDNAAFAGNSTSYGGQLELTRTFSRTSSATLSYDARQTTWDPAGDRTGEQAARGELARRLGADTTVHVDYTFRTVTRQVEGLSGTADSHDVQAGLERRWRHSRVRQTVLNVAAGPSLCEEASASLDFARVRQLRAGGSLALTHLVGAGFSVRGSYRRGAAFRASQRFSNTAVFDLRRDVGTRIRLTTSAGYSDADLGPLRVDAMATRPTTTFGSTRLLFAASHSIGIYGEGFLYRYELEGLAAPPGSGPRVGRSGFRMGLTLWVPLSEGR